jgi:peptidyl-prolyl cis-trans isomerase D
VGLALPEGDYVLYRIESVNRPEIADDDPRVLAVAEQYAQVLAERDFGAFLSELRKRYEVQVKLQPRQ